MNSYLICFLVYLDKGLFAEFRTIYYQTFAVILLNYFFARMIFTPRSLCKGSLEGDILFSQLWKSHSHHSANGFTLYSPHIISSTK